jgi:hypothetical protein
MTTLSRACLRPRIETATWSASAKRLSAYDRQIYVGEHIECTRSGATPQMKFIQRRAYGFRNFENYRLRVIAQCG